MDTADDSIVFLTASEPLVDLPDWAVLERHLLARLADAVGIFLSRVATPDGRLRWDGRRAPDERGDVDDFYEGFTGWALLHLIGGDTHVLAAAKKSWEGVTAQLVEAGRLHDEYEPGYDWFHQAESYQVFVQLCLADPADPAFLGRARRFADLYAADESANYDPELQIIRAPHNGSRGPREGYFGGPPEYSPQAYPFMRPYGLPFHDIEGAGAFDDLADARVEARFAQAMEERFGSGDVVGNLSAAMLAGNAFGLTGDDRYRLWLLEYFGAWQRRAQENGGLVPDNVSSHGVVGGQFGGRWYGGLYGWTWPHGVYSVGAATFVAGSYAALETGDVRYLELTGSQLDPLLDLGKTIRTGDLDGTLGWDGQIPDDPDAPLFVMPYRISDHGWFDFQPPPIELLVNLAFATFAGVDLERLERVRQLEHSSWTLQRPFRNKHDGGHERPWLEFLAGRNPDYPKEALSQAQHQLTRRLKQLGTRAEIEEWVTRPASMAVHLWQELNPVTTEALVQLTMGGPQPVYNGGPVHTAVRYFDPERRSCGLPGDVAALVSAAGRDRVVFELVNLSAVSTRRVIVQAGCYGEHSFEGGTISVDNGAFPGRVGTYVGPPVDVGAQRVGPTGRYLGVELPPLTRAALDLELRRHRKPLSYDLPW